LSEEELVHAHSAARAAAAAVRPIPPPAPASPKAIIQDEMDIDIRAYESSSPRSKPRHKVHPHVWATQKRSSPDYDDESDFIPDSLQQGRPSIDTPSLEGDSDPATRTGSRSSSSADISLPPTPEFNPIDKAYVPTSGKGRDQWDLSVKNIHLAPTSPTSHEFAI